MNVNVRTWVNDESSRTSKNFQERNYEGVEMFDQNTKLKLTNITYFNFAGFDKIVLFFRCL